MEASVEPMGQQADQPTGAAGPLPVELVLGATPVRKEPQLLGGTLFWLEQLPAQRGRTTLRRRSRSGSEQELTPGLDLRSRIHGYGGGVYSVAAGSWIEGSATARSQISGTRSSAAGTAGIDALPLPMDDAPAGEGDRPAGMAPPPHAPLDSPPAGQTVVVVAEGGTSLWRLDLSSETNAESPTDPVRLTEAGPAGAEAHEPVLYGDGLIDLGRQRWIGVCEQNGRDQLVEVPLGGGAPRRLWESPDFCGYAALSPGGSHLAWISWRQPCMPWERSQLWLGRFDAMGDLVEVRAIAGSAPGAGQAVSVFQPLWAGPDLVVANDRSGWWNLEALENAAALAPDAAATWRPLMPMHAEFAMPQWVYGMRTTAWDGQRLVAAACRDGRWELGALVPAADTSPTRPLVSGDIETTASDPNRPPEQPTPTPVPTAPAKAVLASTDGSGMAGEAGASPLLFAEPGNPRRTDPTAAPAGPAASRQSSTPLPLCAARPAAALRGALAWQPIPLPFDDLSALDAENGHLVAIASGPVDGPGLLELHGVTGPWTHHPAAAPLVSAEQISRPEPLWFNGHGGLPTHAWYYPPRGGANPTSPLLVRGHSGPTAMARTGLSLSIQFWTSRGWGVVDVNYGGSTGFGRAYRERLDGGWGVVDVDDCLAAAQALVEAGRAAPERIAMEGSSASGFTVLAAMARGDTIRAGAIRYPVTDLTALAECDHRFEARYFESLVGPWPAARSLYEERSPLQQVDRIQTPLLFFHGLEDTVVPAQQSIAMVERLRQRGVPVELQLFEGEGHGFRDGSVQRQVLERSEAFFRESFALEAPR